MCESPLSLLHSTNLGFRGKREKRSKGKIVEEEKVNEAKIV